MRKTSKNNMARLNLGNHLKNLRSQTLDKDKKQANTTTKTIEVNSDYKTQE